MPPKRTRRTSPARTGLTAGERLKRAKLTGNDYYSAWGWVGTEVLDVSEITQEYRLVTCGFSKRRPHALCANRYAAVPQSDPVKERTKDKQASGELEDDVIVISDDEAPSCSIKSCKSNPYCLNHLGQDKWEKEDSAREAFLKATDLGESPLLHSREPGHPVGLKNLGATCYANAYLQVWFQDLPFRNGVYRCHLPEDAHFKLEESPIFQLQVTFTAMQESTKASFNPIKLVESLKLRTTEQQDAQSLFSKLFMAHLDTEFRKQSDPALQTLIPDQGKQVYGTICEKCHHRSERVSDFLEIEVTIKNNATLEDRIAAMLLPETLSGDNKYFCPQCHSLQDAKRYTELRELPPVLHFSLLRFVYDVSSMERKKSKHTISYPTSIDMDMFLGSTQSRENNKKIARKIKNRYELRGVLLHKGASAYHGHYEAQVFDVQNQAWYQFNDEVVTKIKSLGPKTNSKDALKTDPNDKKKENGHLQKQRGNPKKRRRVDDSDSDIEILELNVSSTSPCPPLIRLNRHSPPPVVDEKRTSGSSAYISSKDAYMLVYSRITDIDTQTDGEEVLQSGSEIKIDVSQQAIHLGLPPPPRAQQVVGALNEAHADACKAYVEKKKQTIAHFDEIRRKVMGIYRAWNLSTRDEGSVVASRQALEAWLSHHFVKPEAESTSNIAGDAGSSAAKSKTIRNGAYGSPIASMTDDPIVRNAEADDGIILMTDILCTHGRLDPDKATDMKVITKVAHHRIGSEDGYQLVPALSPFDVCETCVHDSFCERLYQIEHPRLVNRFEETCHVREDEPGFWISKQWIKDWRLTKPKMHVASQQDSPPDATEFERHVKCEHGGLSANLAARRRISVEAYLLLRRLFPTWETLSTDAELCPVCEALIHLFKEDKRGFAGKLKKKRSAKLKHMHDNALNGNTALLVNIPCAIIPAQFVRSWRQWLLRPGEVPRPADLDNSQFICEHGLLSLDPNTGTDIDSSVTIVKRSDWDVIEDLYSGGPLIAVNNTGSRMEHNIPVCEDCRLKRKSAFEVTEITVRVLASSDPSPSVHTYTEPIDKLSAAFTAYATPPDVWFPKCWWTQAIQSYPARQGAWKAAPRDHHEDDDGNGSKDHEELDIPTICQRLFYRGQELHDSEATVLSLGILSNDLLDLQELDEDISLLSDTDLDVGRRRKTKEGQGFGGTLLGGLPAADNVPRPTSPFELAVSTSVSCPACTFDNPPDTDACTMCGTTLVCNL